MTQHLTTGLNIRPLTKRLVDQLCLDLPLPLPVVTDFGVDTADHYRALRAILLNDPKQEDFDPDDQEQVNRELRKRIVELDQAYGNGAKLNTSIIPGGNQDHKAESVISGLLKVKLLHPVSS